MASDGQSDLSTGSYTCDVFDPIQPDQKKESHTATNTSGDKLDSLKKEHATGGGRPVYECLIALGVISSLVLATVAGAFSLFHLLNGDSDDAPRYHCPSCPSGIDTREMGPLVVDGSKSELLGSSEAPAEDELAVTVANALPLLQELPNVEAVSAPARHEHEPPLVEVVFSTPYETFAGNESKYRARFIADVANTVGISEDRVHIEYVRAGSLIVGFAFLGGGQPSQEQELEIQSELHASERGFGCLPATIVNDFDAAVSATVSGNMTVGEGFIPAAPTEKPYFHDWFGDVTVKDFHHDDAKSKGQVHATYTVPLPTSGCYVVDEWHLGGNQFCHGYMARRVPHAFNGCVGCSDREEVVYVDQAVDGGQWNTIGSFQYEGDTPVATVTVSNDDGGASDPAVHGVTDCTYAGQCYVVWDSLRFVYAGDSCSELETAEDLATISSQACSSTDEDAHHGDSDIAARSIEVSQPVDGREAGSTIDVHWTTTGPVEADRTVVMSLWHGDNNVVTLGATENSGSAVALLPSAEYLQYFTDVVATGRDDAFRIRIDIQHAASELSGDIGWSDRLFGYSPAFMISGLL
eukprot:COSAG02_NODE_1952_length_10284_cov_6.837997_2_plen_580_part_00